MTKDQEREVWLRAAVAILQAHPSWMSGEVATKADGVLAEARARFGSAEGKKHQETIG